ncbi:MAG TPA: oligopeptide transporter, OPT family [Pyrinomonadaceae bacterium]|nr:oligopeptide transporter, OPT family [Pyrinomonadaceae bacterium]
MSSETAGANVGANEFPDRVAVKETAPHTNPLLATFRPYIPAAASIRELTPLPLIVGTLLGMVFGASSLWLVLKVGLTVSASIPVAVISISLFRLLGKVGVREATILENNVVQTAGSAGESIAFGVGVTMPAIMILGFDLEFTRVMLVATMGGLLGILMMIPLRRALIVQQHGLLKYPEGTACAEVLKAGASAESRAAADPSYKARAAASDEADSGAKTIFTGFGIGLVYQIAMAALKGWKDVPSKVFGAPFKAGSLAAEISPALLGVGYIIGPRIASIMCAGGVLAYLVLIPAIKFFGEGSTTALTPGTVPISAMDPDAIRGAYVLYIGAGAVAAGGIISLFRSLPTIWHGLKGGLSDLRGGQAAGSNLPRTDQDLSMKVVVGGVLVLIAMIMILPQLHLQFNLLGAILIIAFGFLFVTVSSRLTGEIGSSSNPISGMTVATLLLTCLIFLIVGWSGPSYYVTALSIGGIVCIAASNGGTTSQDLKTGFLVGATPRYQQIAILIGALASALILGPILLRLNEESTIYVPQTTFRAVQNGPQLDSGAAAALPAYTETTQPPDGGDFRLLRNETATGLVAGLEPGEYLVDGSGKVVKRVERNFPATLRPDMANLGPAEPVKGTGLVTPDPNQYRTWHKVDEQNGAPGKYLVDDQGNIKYYVDPGINGTHRVAPDGSSVSKYDAPKATLMSYIIKGILNQQLPWGLVLLGVMIAIVLEMAGIPSLAFAVGVYLPLSSSSPIFIGGMIRWLVDKYLRVKFKGREMSEEEFIAETDKSPGVLMASGYIAGGALAAVFIAFFAGLWKERSDLIEHWSRENNPFFAGDWANVLSLLPFLVLMIILYLVGREVILAPKRRS